MAHYFRVRRFDSYGSNRQSGKRQRSKVKRKSSALMARVSKNYYSLRFSYGKQSLEVSPFLRKDLFLLKAVLK